MSEKDKLVLVYVGDIFIIERIKAHLEAIGILPIIRDGFDEGNKVGFVGGTPTSIEIFVSESDFKKASEVINEIVHGSR
jgi:hypothetical protein